MIGYVRRLNRRRGRAYLRKHIGNRCTRTGEARDWPARHMLKKRREGTTIRFSFSQFAIPRHVKGSKDWAPSMRCSELVDSNLLTSNWDSYSYNAAFNEGSDGKFGFSGLPSYPKMRLPGDLLHLPTMQQFWKEFQLILDLNQGGQFRPTKETHTQTYTVLCGMENSDLTNFRST